MRITFLAPFYAPKLGGVEIHAQRVAEELVRRGHKVQVITRAHIAGLPVQEEINGVVVERIRFDSGLGEKQLIWRSIFRFLPELWRSDVIHVHDVMWWLAPFWPLLWWKNIHLTHHGWEGIYPVPATNKLQRWVYAKMARSLTHIGEWTQEFYWERPNFISYGAVDGNGESVVRQKLENDSESPHIVFLGRLESENDIELYLQSARIVRSRLPKAQFTWIGDGTFSAECREFGIVTGWQTRPQDFISQADIVWSSSYLSMLQAQVQGKIVGALYSHDLKKRYLETYPGKDFLLLASSPTELSERMLNILADTSTRESRESGSKQWAQRQTWKKLVNALTKLWIYRA